jgi:hypothetical protein
MKTGDLVYKNALKQKYGVRLFSKMQRNESKSLMKAKTFESFCKSSKEQLVTSEYYPFIFLGTVRSK